MSDDATTVLRGAHPGLPLLTDTNFADWDMQVTAYLTGSHDHARVITPIRQADGSYAAPTKPSPAGPNDTPEDVKEADAAISSWNCIASVSSGTARQGAPSTTCTSSYATTISNAMPPQRHEAWFQLLGIRKSPSKPYMAYYRRIEAAYDRIDGITPANQTRDERAR